MNKLSSNLLSFILQHILLLEKREIEREVTESNSIYSNKEKTIYFFKGERKEEGVEVDLAQLRKNYTGTTRKKDYSLIIESKNGELKGVFELRNLKKVWKFTAKEPIEKALLIPVNENSNEAKSLVLVFPSGSFVVNAIKILFPTDNFYQKKIDETEKYANAFRRFKELVPFKIDQIIDLLGTEQLAYSFEEWEENPLEFDIPNVDTANISLAKSIIDELPEEELKLFIKTIREKITRIDTEEEIEKETLERYREALEYAKKLRKKRKKKDGT